MTNCKKIKIVNYKFGGSIEMKANLPEKNFLIVFIFGLIKKKEKNIIQHLCTLIKLKQKQIMKID